MKAIAVTIIGGFLVALPFIATLDQAQDANDRAEELGQQLDVLEPEIIKRVQNVVQQVEGPQGPPGVPGSPGRPGPAGRDGRDGADGTDGRDGRDAPTPEPTETPDEPMICDLLGVCP